MTLHKYFEYKKGTGFLATANKDGKVNTAVYARPHFLNGDDNYLAFVMRDRLTHKYINENPYAFYTFIEDGEGYFGKRLLLKKVLEEADSQKIATVRHKDIPEKCADESNDKAFLVHFKVEEVRPLVETTSEYKH